MAIPIAILDCDLLLHGRDHKALERFDLNSVSDDFLLAQFGFPRDFILYLVKILSEDLCRRTLRSRAISPEVQVLAALGFYTSGSFQTSMGDTIGISQSSMSRCVSNVTKALVKKFFRDPCDFLNRELTYQNFQRIAGFPGVLGVLNCIAIKAPNSGNPSYVNKREFHSVGCQLVCDAQGLLLSVETYWPGGLNETEVLEKSALYKQLQGISEGWLLGETKSLKWLMTPIDIPKTQADFQYNLAHAATHEIGDQTFKALQTRFRCLDSTKGYLQYSPEMSSAILLACCVLHNASLESGLACTLEETEPREQHKSVEQRHDECDSEGEELRRKLISKHFS
uniref:Putative nuclease HARBI1 n=1 Tax=Cynoglossus semilaevis TaxID=244447 RepID=A0A3P8UNK3_CYNSE